MRNQLLCWVLLPLICLCAVATAVAYKLAAKSANDSYDLFLLNSADSIAARLGRNKIGQVVADLPVAAEAILRHNEDDRFYFQIVDDEGHRLTGDSLLPLPRELKQATPKFRNAIVDGEPVRICRISVELPKNGDVFWVQVAQTLDGRERLLQHIFLSILIPQLALLALASLSIWFGIKLGLRPLTRLSRILRQRSKLDLSPVDLGKDAIVELAPVTDALNELLFDADRHLRYQRQFVADAAHQLRTPVTALTTSVEHLNRVNVDPSLTVVLGEISAATDRTAHLINRLLTLARATGMSNKTQKQIDLNAVVNNAAAVLLPQARKRGVDLHFDTPEHEVRLIGHQGDLEEMVSNLLDNAIKYNVKGGSVWIDVKNGDGVSLMIADDGPGIPDHEKDRVFERFYRGATANGAGAGCGLGLSIVSEIVSSHRASIKISDRSGGGTNVFVKFV